MDAQDRRILELEAEVLALTNVAGEVCRRLATISPRHDAAVRGGLDGASRTLSQAHEYALGADARHTFEYAVNCVDIHRRLALAPRKSVKSGARTDGGRAARRTADRRGRAFI